MPLGFATSHPFFVVCIGFLLKPGYSLRYCLLRSKQFTALLLNIISKYLCDLLTFKSSLYNLRSSGSILLSMRAVRSKKLGDRAFMVEAPTLLPAYRRLLFTLLHAEKGHLRNAVANRVQA